MKSANYSPQAIITNVLLKPGPEWEWGEVGQLMQVHGRIMALFNILILLTVDFLPFIFIFKLLH